MNNKGKTETADPPLWKYNHIKAFSTSPKRATPSLRGGANDPKKKLPRLSLFSQKLQHSAWNAFFFFFFSPPLCEFTPFQRAHNSLLGQLYSRVGGKQHFGACSVSSLHVLLSAVKNHVGLNYIVL